MLTRKVDAGRQMSAKNRFGSHHFEKEIVRQVSKYLEADDYHGALQLFEDWFVIGSSILVTLFCYKFLFPKKFLININGNSISDSIVSLIINIICSIICFFVYFVCVIIIGGRHRSLADILHQSSHGCLAKTEILNYILGTFFSGYAIFQSYSVYVKSHVLLHHPFLSNPHRDPDYIGLIENKICGSLRNSETTRKYIINIVSPINSINYIKYIVKNRIYNESEDANETLIRSIYWMVIVFVIFKLNIFGYFILFWIVPFVTSNVWIGSLLELFEHFPMCDDPNIPYVDVLLTKNRIWSSFANFFIGVHWEGYHLVHHLYPKIPSWNYEAVHRVLMQDKTYASLDHGHKGVWSMLKNVIKSSDSK